MAVSWAEVPWAPASLHCLLGRKYVAEPEVLEGCGGQERTEERERMAMPLNTEPEPTVARNTLGSLLHAWNGNHIGQMHSHPLRTEGGMLLTRSWHSSGLIRQCEQGSQLSPTTAETHSKNLSCMHPPGARFNISMSLRHPQAARYVTLLSLSRRPAARSYTPLSPTHSQAASSSTCRLPLTH